MTGLPMDLGYSWPDTYDPKSEQRATLNDDFCHIEHSEGDIDRAIRCVLNIPVLGVDDMFAFGVWMSVSQKSWDIYSAGFNNGSYEVDACFGYLLNSLPGSPTSLLLHANVTFGEGKSRPVVWLHDADHPIVEAQRNGVTLGQVEEWVASATRHQN